MAEVAIPTRRAQATTGGGPHPISLKSHQGNRAKSQRIPPATVGPPPPLGAHIFIYTRGHPGVAAH